MDRSPTTTVRIGPDRIIVDHLELIEPSLVSVLSHLPEAERPEVVGRALRIGLLAICNAGVSVNLDVVRSEFERLAESMRSTQERAADALATTLREHFADGSGHLPRTLEHFLGDSGSLRRMVGDLFDENRRESALGRLNDLLGRYFDGDGSRLAQLLDPTRAGSPLYQFRDEVTSEFRRLSERLTALEEARRARAEERAKGTAKGVDFEDAVEDRLAAFARGAGDVLERTGSLTGDALRSRKGDFVVSLDPRGTGGPEVRIVVEAKDRPMSRRAITEELTAARANRGAAVALAVFTPQHAPPGTAPFCLVGSDVYTVLDPDADASAVGLEAAYRLARACALLAARDQLGQLDAPAVQRSLADITRHLESVRRMKARLTGIGSASMEVSALLDELRDEVLRSVAAIEQQLRVVEPEVRDSLSA
ncbi:MAG: hypothetical protein ACRDGJ_10330 [Candidatus Limnocylindria bacterium]